MIETVYTSFANFFQENIYLATLLIAMVPIIELKGAIPFATNELIWQDFALNNWQALGWSLLGCSLLVPLIAIMFKPIIAMFKKSRTLTKVGCAIENFVLSKSNNIEEKYSASKNYKLKKILFVFAFVAMPFPLTGIWTGTCIAVCMNIDFATTCTSVILGNILAGLIIALILEFFPMLNNWLFFIFLGVVVLFIITKLIIHLLKKKNT